MIDYHAKLLASLKEIGIPVHYEMTLYSGLSTPCISYMELSNVSTQAGDTLGYSHLQKYALLIDKKLRPLGFSRVGCNEMYDNNSSMIQKIMTYEGLALEDF